MIERCWTIDISLPAREIEQQVIAFVEELDELGVFALLRQTAAANDNT